ncbi:MAG: hypothetical protein U0353_13365 [Sandaracinus sp.]
MATTKASKRGARVARETPDATEASTRTKTSAKSAKTSTRELTSRAYENGESAFGARYARVGAAIREELDLAFALGHGAPGHVGPITLLPDVDPAKKPKHSHEAIARNVAIAALRKGTLLPTPAPHEADPAPITEDEARAIVKASYAKLGLTPVYWHALEAMVGPSCLLPAMVQSLDAIAQASWGTGRLHGLVPHLYGLLLRAKERESKDARAALEAILKKRNATHAAARLDVMLHGREGIARRGYKYSPKSKCFQTSDRDEPSNAQDLLFCDGDADFVASQFAALWKAQDYKVVKWMTGPSAARLFFLGGDPTLETELLVVERYPGTMQAEALASYRDLASPLATKLLEKLASPSSKVKAQAEACLAQRGARR